MSAATKTLSPPDLLTYEDYLSEGEINLRYDILDGERFFMANPTRRHQRIQRKIILLFAPFEEATGLGETIGAPCDVLITRVPLRTRQPDVLFISRERLAQNLPVDNPAPLDPAPELVVEIVSPSDTPAVLREKLADYGRANVRECWVLRHALQTIEVLRLTRENAESAAIYGVGSRVQSVVCPALSVSVTQVFAEI